MIVAQAPRSANAYLDYNRLYADGKLEVGAQFGWDYNAGRADLANAEQLYDELVGIGFKSPVATFKDLEARLGAADAHGHVQRQARRRSRSSSFTRAWSRARRQTRSTCATRCSTC